MNEARRTIQASLAALSEEELAEIGPQLLRLSADATDRRSAEAVLRLLAENPQVPPAGLFPFMFVDEASVACLVTAPSNVLPDAGRVVRVFRHPVRAEHQFAVLDIEAGLYLKAAATERLFREASFRYVLKVASTYNSQYVEKRQRPRSFVERPSRVACQNVVIAAYTAAYDAGFDGVGIAAATAVDVAHVATFEGVRALLAGLLCDAFEHSTTLEVRFDRHPEARVPSEILRFARSHGLTAGEEDPAAITPREVRDLFPAVARMPASLAAVVAALAGEGRLAPERVCYMALTGLWSPPALEYVLRTSEMGIDVLHGGSPVEFRAARQAQYELARAAIVLEMLVGAADTVDLALCGGSGRETEDRRQGVAYEIDPELAAVRLWNLPARGVPWIAQGLPARFDELWVVPRSTVDRAALASARTCATRGPTALVLPTGEPAGVAADDGLGVIWCPDRREQLDVAVFDRVSRAGRLG